MSKPSDFSYHLTKYLGEYLPFIKNYSVNTIRSYRDTFKLFLLYFNEELNIPTHKIQIKNVTPDAVKGFLEWLKEKRRSSVCSANIRLAAIHAFFKYLQNREPQYIFQCQQIMAVEMARAEKAVIGYLSVDDLYLMLSQVDESTTQGKRHATLLYLLYDTGARVQELCDLKVRDVHLGDNPYVLLHGKGNKGRNVPIVTDVAHRVEKYIAENRLSSTECRDMPLFFNSQRKQLTRAGVSYIVSKYAASAHKISPSFPEKITPHILRHTKAMHLCQAGINIVYVRDFLGHVDLATTEIYAKMNIELLRDALEDAYPELPTEGLSDWKEDDSLMEFLKKL